MSAISKEVTDAEIEDLGAQKPWGTRIVDTMRRKPLGAFGALIVLVMIFMALLADVITPYNPLVETKLASQTLLL